GRECLIRRPRAPEDRGAQEKVHRPRWRLHQLHLGAAANPAHLRVRLWPAGSADSGAHGGRSAADLLGAGERSLRRPWLLARVGRDRRDGGPRERAWGPQWHDPRALAVAAGRARPRTSNRGAPFAQVLRLWRRMVACAYHLPARPEAILYGQAL